MKPETFGGIMHISYENCRTLSMPLFCEELLV